SWGPPATPLPLALGTRLALALSPGWWHCPCPCHCHCRCPQEPSLYTVKAIIILDNDGERLFAKYYDDTYPSVKEQRAFEKNIFSKTHRSDSEIALLDGLTVVYKSSIDLYCCVIGSATQNEVGTRGQHGGQHGEWGGTGCGGTGDNAGTGWGRWGQRGGTRTARAAWGPWGGRGDTACAPV
uniref:Coatomer subunit zeta n=1 Tax=Serinus canaria TaxID=9135 RepID=A0A8C9MWG0_SERCA